MELGTNYVVEGHIRDIPHRPAEIQRPERSIQPFSFSPDLANIPQPPCRAFANKSSVIFQCQVCAKSYWRSNCSPAHLCAQQPVKTTIALAGTLTLRCDEGPQISEVTEKWLRSNASSAQVLFAAHGVCKASFCSYADYSTQSLCLETGREPRLKMPFPKKSEPETQTKTTNYKIVKCWSPRNVPTISEFPQENLRVGSAPSVLWPAASGILSPRN